MTAAVAFVAGALVAALLWRAMAAEFAAADVLRRTNYRGHELPVGAGVIVVLAVAVVAAAWSSLSSIGGRTADEVRSVAAVVGFAGGAFGFGFLGLVDDLVGAVATKGFRGHLGALWHRRVTTGFVKLVGGVVVGVLVVPADGWAGIRGGLIVAAAANVGNLFDRAPGRCIKVCLAAGALVLALGGAAVDQAGMTLVLGAGLGLLAADLRERCMLGDTGSNVLGASVGFGSVLAFGATGEWIALAVLVGLNLLSERVSFTRVIDAVAPLRAVDRWGAIADRRAR